MTPADEGRRLTLCPDTKPGTFTKLPASNPVKGPEGKTIYLSTDGVAKAVVAHAGSAQALGKVVVVGHRDRVKRCVLVSRDNGMTAAVAREVPLPVKYDPQSVQPWTRRRDAYLLSDLIAQLSMTRNRVIGELAG